jgi:hypothetical protein
LLALCLWCRHHHPHSQTLAVQQVILGCELSFLLLLS